MRQMPPVFDEATIARLRDAAKFLGQTRRGASEKELLLDLAEISRDTATLKALYWAAMRDFDLQLAARVVEDLKADAHGNPKLQKWLEKTKSAPIGGIPLVDEMNDLSKVTPYTPVQGRVLYLLHNSLPYSSGGYATRAHGFAMALQRAGLDPICMTRPGYPHDTAGDHIGKELPAEDEIDGLPYRRIFSPSRKGLSGPPYMAKAADALCEAIEEYRPAGIIAASNFLTALPACVAARRYGLPFIYEVRGFWEVTRLSREPGYVETSNYKLQVFFETQVAKAADHVLTLTGPMREELIERGIDGDTVTLAPNACNPEHFSPRPRNAELAERLGIPEDVPVIGYIGSFVQYEGLEHLVEAAVQLRDRGHDFRLMLVGSENASGNDRGPITEEIWRIAEEAGLGGRLILPGRVPHSEVDAYYSLIDIAPFPRKPQPVTEMVSPMKPLEAFAMEKAVVVSSVKALKEMVQDDLIGLVFEKGNITAMADVLARLIEDPALRTRLGKAGRAWVEKERTWQSTAQTALADLAARQVAIHPDVNPKSSPAPVSGDPALTTPEAEASPDRKSAEPQAPIPTRNLSGKPLFIDADGVPNMPIGRANVYKRVKAKFDARDEKAGKVSFSRNDWLRTKTAFALLGKARKVIDIGIGQGQLINMFCEAPYTSHVVGIDRVKNTKLIPPKSEKYEFVSLDITKPFPADLMKSDVTIAMEIFEHLDVHKVDRAIRSSRASSRYGMLFASVPYQEKHPLYHHDKPFGHKQSFDESKVRECFGEEAIWTNFKDLWYLIFVSEDLDASGLVSFERFVNMTSTTFERRSIDEGVLTDA